MNRFEELTALRGVFMLMIFLFHVHLFPGGGTLGVSFFFILSGFSLTYGYRQRIKEGSFSYKVFMRKRLVRFMPLHWLTLIFACLVYYNCFFSLIPEFFANMFLIQSWIPFQDYYLSFNSVSWYLSDTLFFVALFPFLIKYTYIVPKITQCIIAGITLIGYITLIILLPEQWYSAFLYVNPVVRLIDFLIGVYTALFFYHFVSDSHKGLAAFINKNKWIIVLFLIFTLIVLILISLSVENSYRKISMIYWPFVVTLLLGASLLAYYGKGGNLLCIKPLLWLGSISFTFYMIHQLIIIYIDIFSYIIDYECDTYLMTSLAFVISLSCSVVVDRYFVRTISNKLISKQPN